MATPRDDWEEIGDEMRYLILHSDPQGLVMSQSHRDMLFSTGNVIDVLESSVYSVQKFHFERVTRRPLTLVLWNMADRYGEAERAGIAVIEAKDWAECHDYAQHKRPYPRRWTDNDGFCHPYTLLARPGTESEQDRFGGNE